MPSNVWKGNLTFGLVSVPVKLYRAARRERVRMHYVHRTPAEVEEEPESQSEEPAAESMTASPRRPYVPQNEPPPVEPEYPGPVTRVQQSLVAPGGDQPVRRGELLKGYEVARDQYVVFDPAELKGLRRKTSAAMEIVRSVKLSEIDPVFFETSYYVVPDRGGEKAYAILFAALRETGHVALARVGMHGREHVVIIRPGKHGMIAHTMFYVDEIRFENEFRTDVDSVLRRELDMAKTFLQALEAPFAPEEFKDEYREELQAMIASRAAELPLNPAVQPAAAPTPVIDIFEALKKSIAMAKKPARAEEPVRKTPDRVTEIKNRRPSRKAR